MKYKDPITGEIKDITIKSGDTLPIGTIVDFDGDTIPDGYEEATEASDVVNSLEGNEIYRAPSVKAVNEVLNGTKAMGSIIVEDIKSKNDFPLLNNFNSAGISITSNIDGTYNITGKATTNIECVIFKNIEDTIIKNGGTYTLSTNQSLPTGVNSRIEFYNNASYVRGFLTVINTASNNPTAVANTTNVNKVRFGLFVTSGTTVNITNLGLQLEKGSVATDYVEHKEFDCTGIKGNVLWTNPNTSAAFPAQTINLNNENWDVAKIYYKNVNGEIFSQEILKTYSNSILEDTQFYYDATNGNGIVNRSRYIRDITGSKIRFTACNTISVYASKSTYIENNNEMIPLLIIGYKTNLI